MSAFLLWLNLNVNEWCKLKCGHVLYNIATNETVTKGIFDYWIRIWINSESTFGFTWQIKWRVSSKQTTVTKYDVTVVCLCCFWSYFVHFNSSQPSCCLFSAVFAINVFLKSFIIVSTHRQCHVASKTGFKQDSPSLNLVSDFLFECTISLNLNMDSP